MQLGNEFVPAPDRVGPDHILATKDEHVSNTMFEDLKVFLKVGRTVFPRMMGEGKGEGCHLCLVPRINQQLSYLCE